MLLSATLALVLISGVASASPVRVHHDRSDNTMSFTFDATHGSMPVVTSSERIARNDPLSFQLTLTPRPGVVVGHVHLKLLAERPRRLAGRFSLVVTASDGSIAARKAIHRTIVVHPARGRKTASLRIPVHLGSGSYAAFARFSTG